MLILCWYFLNYDWPRETNKTPSQVWCWLLKSTLTWTSPMPSSSSAAKCVVTERLKLTILRVHVYKIVVISEFQMRGVRALKMQSTRAIATANHNPLEAIIQFSHQTCLHKTVANFVGQFFKPKSTVLFTVCLTEVPNTVRWRPAVRSSESRRPDDNDARWWFVVWLNILVPTSVISAAGRGALPTAQLTSVLFKYAPESSWFEVVVREQDRPTPVVGGQI